MDEPAPSVFRPNSISYLRIPAPDASQLSAFYGAVFSWTLRERPYGVSFTDGSGHVIGHFIPELAVAGEAGARPYIFVESVDRTSALITAHGGTVVVEPYEEGDLWVACFRDPAGHVLGIWQLGPRG